MFFLNKFSNKGLVKYFKNTSWLLSERFFRLSINLVVGIWVANYLKPESYGLLNYSQSFVFLFIAICTLGLDDIVIREILHKKNKNEILGTSFLLKVIGGLISIIFISLIVYFSNSSIENKLLILVISFGVIFQSFNVIDFYFQAKVLSKNIAYSNFLTQLISALLKILLILNNAPLISFALVLFIDSLILAIFLSFFYYKNTQYIPVKSWTYSYSLAKKLLNESWPLIFSGILISIYMKIDLIMIREIIDDEAAGFYSAAVRLSEAWYFIPLAISKSLFPSILGSKKINSEIYNNRMIMLYCLMIWMSIFVGIFVNVFGDSIITFLYNGIYDQSSIVLVIHIWAGIFVSIGVASHRWFIAENLQIYSTFNTGIGAIMNVILNYFLITNFGILGGAISTFFSYFLAAYLMLFFFKKTRINFINISKGINPLSLIK